MTITLLGCLTGDPHQTYPPSKIRAINPERAEQFVSVELIDGTFITCEWVRFDR